MTRNIKGIVGVSLIVSAIILLFLVYGSFKDDGTSISSENNIEEDIIEPFPNKTIQIVVPFAPGGGTDSVARALADSAKRYFTKPIVVVNKTGDGGAVGMTEGANSSPDGHIITMITGELITLPNLSIAPFTYRNFKPIVQVNADPAALTVRGDAPWNNVKDFIRYAKQHPGEVKIGNSGEGAIWHLAAMEIENKTGSNFNHMFFDGAAPAVVNLLGGDIDAVTVSPAEVLTHVENGQLKVLGVLSSKRINSLPKVKTFKEQGYNCVIGTWRGLGVPKDTPEEVVNILEERFTKAANDPDFIKIMDRLGLGYKVSESEEFLEIIEENDDFIKELVKVLNVNR